MDEKFYYVIGIIILFTIFWYFSNNSYFYINKLLRKTRNDVDNCIEDVKKIKSDIDRFKNTLISIDDRITHIESKIK